MIAIKSPVIYLLMVILLAPHCAFAENNVAEEFIYEELGEPNGGNDRVYVLIPHDFMNNRKMWITSVERVLNGISSIIFAAFDPSDDRQEITEVFPSDVAAEMNKNGVTFIFVTKDFSVRQVRIPLSVASE